MVKIASMQVLVVRCGSCGAAIQAKPVDDLVVCEYCNTQSLIQRRQGVLERAVEPPRRQDYPDLPLATQSRSARFWAGGGSLLLIPVGTIAIFSFLNLTAWWEGSRIPLLADLNGDGIADAIGRIERCVECDDPEISIGAIDGNTAEMLWETEALGEGSSSKEGSLTLFDDVIVFAHRYDQHHEGPAMGFSARDGKKLWSGAPIESPKSVCRQGDKLVYEIPSPKKAVAIDPRTGARSEPDKSPCSAVQTSLLNVHRLAADIEFGTAEDLADINVNLAIRRPGQRWTLIGRQKLGTSAVWVGLLDSVAPRSGNGAVETRGAEMVWKSQVVKRERVDLESSLAAISEDQVFVVYADTKEPQKRIASLSLADGELLWDVAIGWYKLSGILYATGRLYVSANRGLYILDSRTGDELARFRPF